MVIFGLQCPPDIACNEDSSLFSSVSLYAIGIQLYIIDCPCVVPAWLQEAATCFYVTIRHLTFHSNPP